MGPVRGNRGARFDEIDHTALMGRLRRRVEDRRVLNLVKAFLKAGLLDEAGINREAYTGTPQGGILHIDEGFDFLGFRIGTIQVPIFSTASGEQRMQPSTNLPTGRSSWMVMVSVPRRITVAGSPWR